jgi:hypothetical protein
MISNINIVYTKIIVPRKIFYFFPVDNFFYIRLIRGLSISFKFFNFDFFPNDHIMTDLKSSSHALTKILPTNMSPKTPQSFAFASIHQAHSTLYIISCLICFLLCISVIHESLNKNLNTAQACNNWPQNKKKSP